jgi:CheY-like chemotaxis protein
MKELIRCLLVDDDFDDREVFLLTLAELGNNIRCRTAGNGIEALHILEAENAELPDFIFLDINMPRMNGIECLDHIRNTEKYKDCKVFIYSTTADPELITLSKNLNAGYIVKPVQVSELRETLRGILIG